MTTSIGRTAALAVYALSAATVLASNLTPPGLQVAQSADARPATGLAAVAGGDQALPRQAAHARRPVTVEDISAAESAAVEPVSSPVSESAPTRHRIPDARLLETFEFQADFARDTGPGGVSQVHAAVPTGTAEPALSTGDRESILPYLLPLGMVLVGVISLVALVLRPGRSKADPYFGG